METTEVTKLPLTKKSTSYDIVIPAEVERKIRFLCERVWDTEWSGVLFYTYSGNFEDGSLEIRCKDILPMDIGSTTYTEFDMSPDVISYMAQNPELLDCKMGLIHSHNNMSTFFSGTDIETLREEGRDRNHFVSLIVNNAGKYTAAITRKIKYTSVRDLSYEGFDGVISLPDKEVVEGEELEYFNLNIVFEEEQDVQFAEVANRLKEIKESKAKAVKSYNKSYSSHYSPFSSQDNSKFGAQGTLFDDWSYDENKPVFVQNTKFDKEAKDTKKEVTTPDKVVEGVINQLVSGSVTLTNLNEDLRGKMIESMDTRFTKRFGEGDAGMKKFNFWATDFIEFLLWYSIDDNVEDEFEALSQLADKVIAVLRKLPSNAFINEYIDILLSYGSRSE